MGGGRGMEAGISGRVSSVWNVGEGANEGRSGGGEGSGRRGNS